ncbi:hypothetical protein ONZ51_g10892 [Trametes cubensis]|uniref:DUF6534 domain-containing protein n=1 Tax=Trametes cubensis TaxID=1111947 RepID=A0AAD7X5X0_9APHY|nr:hypothetical protein ONZ51_g10892 [Trametes cubensis]
MSTDVSDTPALSPSVLHHTLGALLLGTNFGLIIYGVTLFQAYRYFCLYPRDSYVLKALVALVLMMDAVTSAFGIYACYYTMVDNFLRAEVLLYSPWSIKVCLVFFVPGVGLAMVSCQSFFAWRVWRVAPKLRFLVVVAGALSIGELGKAIHTWGDFCVFAIRLHADMRGVIVMPDHSPGIPPWGHSGSPTYSYAHSYPHSQPYGVQKVRNSSGGGRRRTALNQDLRMDSKIHTLIVYAFNTGLLTGLCNLFFVVFAFTIPETLFPVAAGFIGFKMYATTLLAALNMRQTTACRCSMTTPSVNLVFGHEDGGRAPACAGTVSGPSGTRVGSGCQWELEACRDGTVPIARALMSKPREEESPASIISTKVAGSFAVEG